MKSKEDTRRLSGHEEPRIKSSPEGDSDLIARVSSHSVKKGVFYGWFLLPICLCNITITYGVMHSFSPIFVALLSEYGLDRAYLSGIFSLFMFVMFAGAVIAGPLLDRYGPRVVIPAGACLMGLGLGGCGWVSSPSQLYLYFGVITGLGACLGGWVPSTLIIANWFERKRGMAIGVVTSGMGLSILIFVPLAQTLIDRVGWRGAFWGIAVVVLVIGMPLNALFQRAKPADSGQAPDGDPFDVNGLGTIVGGSEMGFRRDWTLREAMGQRSFWMVCLGLFFNPMATFAIALHAMALVVGRGFAPDYVAWVLGLTGVFSIIGRVACGTLSDRIGRKPAYTVFMASAALGVASLLILNQDRSWILSLYVVLGGLGLGVGAGMYPAIVADLFPGPHKGKIMGVVSVFGGFGSGFGSWLVGYLHDITGEYNSGFLCVLAAILAAVVFFCLAAPQKSEVHPDSLMKNGSFGEKGHAGIHH